MGKLAKFWKSISVPQAIVLVALVAGVTVAIVFAPPHLYEKLWETSPTALAAWITIVGTAVLGVFTSSRKAKDEE